MQATKLNDNSISVTQDPVTPAPEAVTYDYDYLISQRSAIIKSANDFLALRQIELDQVNALIDQCDQLGVVSAVMPQPLADPAQTVKSDISSTATNQ